MDEVRLAKLDASAQRYQRISFDEAINKNLKVMDATALALCRDQQLPIKVFSISRASCRSAPGGSGAAAKAPAICSELMPIAASNAMCGFIMVPEA